MNHIAFLNGEFIEEERASLHISDLSVQRGYGIFDAFRTIHNVPVFLDDHLNRFFHSAAGLRLAIDQTGPALKSIVSKLMDHNNISDSIFRITLTGGYSPDSYQIAKPNLIITQHPLNPRPAEWVKNGLRIVTHEHEREFPHIKTINYLTGIWLQEKISASGATDVLYHNKGEVLEFPRSNFFIVTANDVVVTPVKNILHGITRMKTIELARQHFTAGERTVTMNDIRQAKEAFLTSTTKQIIPVVQVDDIVIGDGKPGAVTRFLDERLQELCNNHINMLLPSPQQ